VSRTKTSEILRRAKDTLETARAGLKDVEGHPSRRLTGLRNLVVFGRAFTNVLQNLRSTESNFDAWYAPHQQQLAADPMMKFFYDLRTRILKRGETGVGAFTHLKSFQPSRDMARFGPSPPNAKGFFIGDQAGGTGWQVEVSPGVVEPYYVDLPSDIGSAGLFFTDAPSRISGSPPTEAEVTRLCTYYLAHLDRLYRAAVQEFGTRP
jgi:hypothetical protein